MCFSRKILIKVHDNLEKIKIIKKYIFKHHDSFVFMIDLIKKLQKITFRKKSVQKKLFCWDVLILTSKK